VTEINYGSMTNLELNIEVAKRTHTLSETTDGADHWWSLRWGEDNCIRINMFDGNTAAGVWFYLESTGAIDKPANDANLALSLFSDCDGFSITREVGIWDAVVYSTADLFPKTFIARAKERTEYARAITICWLNWQDAIKD